MRGGRREQRIILSLLKIKDLVADFQGLLKYIWSQDFKALGVKAKSFGVLFHLYFTIWRKGIS